jgi:fructokinase
MPPKKIYALGETVLDIIFKDGQPQAAKPGGAMLNSSVSLGRAGLPVSFISDYGLDEAGRLIDDSLAKNGVDTSLVNRYRKGQTALALAFLDDKNDAHYNFYRNFPKERLNTGLPDFKPGDILLFGSFYSITPEIRKSVEKLVQNARENQVLVIYDPNFRKAHLHELEQLRPYIIENIKNADLIRGSDEDFKIIFGAGSPEEAYGVISQFCPCMVYTASSEGVWVRTPTFSGRFPVKKITPVSTIGAGDNFNAGMISALYRYNIGKLQIIDIGHSEWENIIRLGVEFASDVCMGYDNYISWEMVGAMKRDWGLGIS